MKKEEVLNQFWNSFGVTAYDESTLPNDVRFPYITYDIKTDSFGNVVNMSANIWDRNTSWRRVSEIKDAIAKRIGQRDSLVFKIDEGRLWLQRGTPFAQRMRDSDDMIRRIYLNIQVEYLTKY